MTTGIHPGDTLKIKGQWHPTLTVEFVYGDLVYVCWFDNALTLHRDKFYHNMLEGV